MDAMRGSMASEVASDGPCFCTTRFPGVSLTSDERGWKVTYRLSQTFRLPMLIRASVGPYCASTAISMILVMGSTRKRLSKSFGAACAAWTLERR